MNNNMLRINIFNREYMTIYISSTNNFKIINYKNKTSGFNAFLLKVRILKIFWKTISTRDIRCNDSREVLIDLKNVINKLEEN